MPDSATELSTDAASGASVRAGRAPFVAFLADEISAEAVRIGFAAEFPENLDVRVSSFGKALQSLQKSATPSAILIDISDESHPLDALGELANIVEPQTRVMVVGLREDMNFYRSLTHDLGVVEYLYKPLAPDIIARHFVPIVSGKHTTGDLVRGGRLISVTGATGGAGASTLAANLAWYLAHETARHTLLWDPDLYLGGAGILLNASAADGLATAYEDPGRIDDLFVERAALVVSERLSILCGSEKPSSPIITPSAEAMQRLRQAVRKRYNFIIADTPWRPALPYSDLIEHVHQRIFVLAPTLASVRNALQLLAIPNGEHQVRRALLVLNREGDPGCLNRREIEEGLGCKIDVTIPYLPKVIPPAATMGKAAYSRGGALADAIVEIGRQVAFVGAASRPKNSFLDQFRAGKRA